MRASYRAALVCGASPLVAGISVFLLWVVTRREWLMGAGLPVLFVGLALFAVSTLAVARFCWLALRGGATRSSARSPSATRRGAPS